MSSAPLSKPLSVPLCFQIRCCQFDDDYNLFKERLVARIPKISIEFHSTRQCSLSPRRLIIICILRCRSCLAPIRFLFSGPLFQQSPLHRLRDHFSLLPFPHARVLALSIRPRRVPHVVHRLAAVYSIISYISAISSSSSAFLTAFCAFSHFPPLFAPVSSFFSLLFGHVCPGCSV